MHPSPTLRLAAAALLLTALGACDAGSVTDSSGAARMASSSGATLVECPTDTGAFVTGTIGTLGGAIQLKKNKLVVPQLGVIGPTEFRLAENVSKFMELDLRGNDQEAFGFEKTAHITIDYSRCARSNIDKGPLSVWKINPATKALLKQMPVVSEDKVARTITFSTDSLSAYSVAN